MPYSQDNPVEDRLLFAERRMNDLRSLNNGNLGGAVPRERQQLIQEFFFHLVGAIDFLAQEVNIARGLGLDAEDVSPSRVRQALTATDPVQELIAQLHPYTRQKPLPSNPYSEEGSHFRIMLFRMPRFCRDSYRTLFRIYPINASFPTATPCCIGFMICIRLV